MSTTHINKTAFVDLKQVVKLKYLPLNTPYSIVGAKIVNCQFGEALLLTFDDFNCNLSKKSTESFKQNSELLLWKILPGVYGNDSKFWKMFGHN